MGRKKSRGVIYCKVCGKLLHSGKNKSLLCAFHWKQKYFKEKKNGKL